MKSCEVDLTLKISVRLHFNQCSSLSIVRGVGVISTLSWSIGPLIGGPIVSRMKITVNKALCLTVIFHVISFSGYLLAFFINCAESPWAGKITDSGLITIIVVQAAVNIFLKIYQMAKCNVKSTLVTK